MKSWLKTTVQKRLMFTSDIFLKKFCCRKIGKGGNVAWRHYCFVLARSDSNTNGIKLTVFLKICHFNMRNLTFSSEQTGTAHSPPSRNYPVSHFQHFHNTPTTSCTSPSQALRKYHFPQQKCQHCCLAVVVYPRSFHLSKHKVDRQNRNVVQVYSSACGWSWNER